jgi:hypothetical protein
MKKARRTTNIKQISGKGFSSSPTSGAKSVTIRAKKLQTPIAVVLLRNGKIISSTKEAIYTI